MCRQGRESARHTPSRCKARCGQLHALFFLRDLADRSAKRAMCARIAARAALPFIGRQPPVGIDFLLDAARRSRVALAGDLDRGADDGKALAYVCEGFVCQLPVGQPEELVAQLTGQRS